MKIAMIGQKGIPSRSGGVEIHVEEIAKGLIEDGVEVDVYCRKAYCDDSKSNYKGINLKYIPSINTKSLDAITYTIIATVCALFKNYDVFHYHALGPSSMAWLPKIFGKKVICTVHGLDWKREKWGNLAKKYLKFGEYVIAKYADSIIVLTKSMEIYFKEVWQRETNVIPNGVEIGELVEAQIIKEKYKVKKDSYILFLARLVPEKGAHYLINAFNSIETDKKLIIAGGSSYTDKYVEYIKDLAKNNNNIIFTGVVRGKELNELYSNAYFYVLPSEIEGLPISLLEAMSFSNCCLVSDIDENLETIEICGLSFKSKCEQDLKLKLEELINNEELVKKYKIISEDFVSKKYNWKTIINETKKVYRKVLF